MNTTRINFNFTEEQQELFSNYYSYVKTNHPSLLGDEIMKTKIKTVLAYAVTNGGDLPPLPETFVELEEKAPVEVAETEEEAEAEIE